jgi:hypothetical protein
LPQRNGSASARPTTAEVEAEDQTASTLASSSGCNCAPSSCVLEARCSSNTAGWKQGGSKISGAHPIRHSPLAGVLDLSNLSLQIVRQDAMLLPVIFSSESEASNVEDTSVTMGRALSLEVKDLIGSALRMPPVPEAASWECRLPVGLNWQGVLQMAASSSFSRRGQNHSKLAVKPLSSFNYRGRFQSTQRENFRRIWN